MKKILKFLLFIILSNKLYCSHLINKINNIDLRLLRVEEVIKLMGGREKFIELIKEEVKKSLEKERSKKLKVIIGSYLILLLFLTGLCFFYEAKS